MEDYCRLDKLLVIKNLVDSRAQAHKLIRLGLVQVGANGIWSVVDKASAKIATNADIEIGESPELRYVSRAGLKLEGALHRLMALGVINEPLATCARGVHAIDIGQSTGGFTDCLLRANAERVVGIEVGHDQLSAALRGHPRVIVCEGVNARTLSLAEVRGAPTRGFDWAVMDVSFISQKLILPRLPEVLVPGGLLISLVKPQFEVGKAGLGKGGVVKDETLFADVRARITSQLLELNFAMLDYFESCVHGGDGNREFFAIAVNRHHPPGG